MLIIIKKNKQTNKHYLQEWGATSRHAWLTVGGQVTSRHGNVTTLYNARQGRGLPQSLWEMRREPCAHLGEGSSGQRELAPRGRGPERVVKGEREAEGESRGESGAQPLGDPEDHRKRMGFALSGMGSC